MHPLDDGEDPCDLCDYSSIESDHDVVVALKEGSKEAQKVLRVLNVAPSVHAREKNMVFKTMKLEAAGSKAFGIQTYKMPSAHRRWRFRGAPPVHFKCPNMCRESGHKHVPSRNNGRRDC